ncbi:MAG TPA: ABA4-like family protein [Pseudonocardia sp.]|nr:ABA4-like family protein [Pseudonocardia sp.]
MDPALLFTLSFPLAAPFWALMILAPGWSVTRRIIGSPLIVVPPALVYALVVLPELGAVLPAVTDPSPAAVALLLGSPVGAAAGWAHFVAFDLFVGRWMYLDARERGIHPLVMAPVLVLTILLAPLGLLVYLMLRAVFGVRPVATAPVAGSAGHPARRLPQ